MNKKIAAVLLLATIASPLYAAEKLTVVSFGGNNRQAQEKAFYKPFTAQTGVAITADDYNGEMAKIKVMADTGKTSWDVVEVESPELIRGCSEGVFEPLDWSRIGNKEDFIPAAVSDCGVGIFIWSTVLTYDPKKLASSPQGWADFKYRLFQSLNDTDTLGHVKLQSIINIERVVNSDADREHHHRKCCHREAYLQFLHKPIADEGSDSEWEAARKNSAKISVGAKHK